MDWRDLNPQARLSLAQEILSSLGANLLFEKRAQSDGFFFRLSRTRGRYDPSFLAEMARDELYWRARRRKYVDLEIYGEAAWSILLDLYVNGVRGRNTSIMSACIASEVPPTTALRYIAMLETEGLIVSEEAQTDQRVRWVRLSGSGIESVECYLTAKADDLTAVAQPRREGGAIATTQAEENVQ